MSKSVIVDPVTESIEKQIFVIPEHQKIAEKHVEQERTKGLRKNKSEFKSLYLEGLSFEERQISAVSIRSECINLNKCALKVAKLYRVALIEEADKNFVGCYSVVTIMSTETEESYDYYLAPSFICDICFIPPHITTVSPASELGKKLFGKQVGHLFEMYEFDYINKERTRKKFLITKNILSIFPQKINFDE